MKTHHLNFAVYHSVLHRGLWSHSNGDYRTVTMSQANAIQISRNLLDFVEKIPEQDRETLVIIGELPLWLYCLISNILLSKSTPYFKEWTYENGTGDKLDNPLHTNSPGDSE